MDAWNIAGWWFTHLLVLGLLGGAGILLAQATINWFIVRHGGRPIDGWPTF